MRYRTKNPSETQRIAGFVVENLKKFFIRHSVSNKKVAMIVAFSGQLGAGKTTLVQGLGRKLGIREKIQSPTFVILKKYKIKKRGIPWRTLVHVDAYRLPLRPPARNARAGGTQTGLGGKKEPFIVWLKEIFKNPENLVAIEWPDKIKKHIPRNALWIELKHKGGEHRHIIIKP